MILSIVLIQIQQSVGANSTELIESSDIDLAIYEFNISAVSDTVTKQSLYTIQYRIGTSDVNF